MHGKHGRRRVGEGWSFGPPSRFGWLVPLVLISWLCTCDPAPLPEEQQEDVWKNAVLLTDSTQWAPGQLAGLRDSLHRAGYRTLVSGTTGETAAELLARLPWLRQPGVDRWLYDPELAGPELLDSLTNRLGVRPSELVRSPSGPVVRSRRK